MRILLRQYYKVKSDICWEEILWSLLEEKMMCIDSLSYDKGSHTDHDVLKENVVKSHFMSKF